jgi:NADPH2:quinone reductase
VRAVGLDEFGGPDVLHVVSVLEPAPAAAQIRIRVRAAAVNPTDATFRSGGRAANLSGNPPPYIPGMDAAGVVDQLGPDTDGRFSVGDPVIALVIPFGPRGGTYADRIVVDQASVVPAPLHASPYEAATLLLNAVTAHLALEAVQPQPGGPVLVTGSAGGVGGFAIQLATSRGLRVIADASPADATLARELGADTIVPRGDDFADRVKAAVPEGVRSVVDAADLREGAAAALEPGGFLASLKGWAGPSDTGVTVVPISSFGSVTDTALLTAMSDLAGQGVLRLRVRQVLPAEQAAQAHRLLAQRGLRGRVVLDFDRPGGAAE